MEHKYNIKTMQKDLEGLGGELEASSPVTTPVTTPEPPKEELIKKPFRYTRVIAWVLVLVIGLTIIGGLYYWWNYLRAVDELELEIPISLIEMERIEIIDTTDVNLVEELKKKARGFQEMGTFRRILAKKDNFLSFKEVLEILGVNISANISDKLGNDYTLFLYSQGEENRLGIIVKISDFDNFTEELKLWEQTIRQDLVPFFLGKETDALDNGEFLDNAYQDVTIRYLNLPDTSLTIDYATVGDYLIITTSKGSMYGVIDKILNKNLGT